MSTARLLATLLLAVACAAAGGARASAGGAGRAWELAFVRSTGGGESGAPVKSEIWEAASDGSGLHRITAGGAPLVWSPDGTRLLFTRFAAGRYSLYVVDAGGGHVRRVAPGTSAGSWLSDVAVAVMRPARGGYAVYRLDLAARGKLRKLFVLPGPASWSPDGRRLAYAGARGGLYVAAADGKARRRVGTADSIPTWSPDGRRLLYDRKDAVCATVVATAATTCFAVQNGATSATWTPDGTAIVFASFDNPTLVLSRPGGARQRSLLGYSQLFGSSSAGRLEGPAARPTAKP